MKWANMYVSGTGVCLPVPVSVAEMVRAGKYPKKLAQISGQEAVTVADPSIRAVDMAAMAAHDAMATSGHTGDDMALLFHAVVLDAGVPVWAVASGVQDRAGIGHHCRAQEIRQGCNGALAGLELAAAWLTATRDAPDARPAALITAADVWRLPEVDRWTWDPDLPAADGGAALVVSSRGGWAEILTTATRSDPSLEGAHRGKEPFGPGVAHRPVNFSERVHEWIAEGVPGFDPHADRKHHEAEMWRRHGEVFAGAYDAALAEVGVKPQDLACVVLPHLGQTPFETHYLPHLDVAAEMTTWDGPGRSIGHMGAADSIAALHHARADHRFGSGDLVAVLSEGIGITATAMILRVVG